jgi:hypothetical protein
LIAIKKHDLPGMALMTVVVALIVSRMFYASRPVKSIVEVEATVEGISLAPSRVGTSSRYSYTLRLEDGTVIIASDYLSRPHIKGSRVTIERVTRENGRISHRFPFLGGSVLGDLLDWFAR